MEKEAAELRELEALRAQVRADANMKAKLAESEGRLLCTSCQSEMLPDEQGNYEFETIGRGKRVPSIFESLIFNDQAPNVYVFDLNFDLVKGLQGQQD